MDRKEIITDNERLVCEYSLAVKNVVILHGAGQADRQRYYPMAEELVRQGAGVVLFDFSGHGESTGTLRELSLERRTRQAQAVIDEILPANSTFCLAGFSMSGQTVCDLLPTYRARIETVLLGCPGIYTESVRSLPFGSPAFTRHLRAEESWRNSRAPKLLSEFAGRTIIAIGSEDNVIPADVITLLRQSAKHLDLRRYDGVSHQLAAWLGEHPVELRELLALLINI